MPGRRAGADEHTAAAPESERHALAPRSILDAMELDLIDIAAFGGQHLDDAVRLSQEAGWPHRRADWELALAQGAGFAATDGDGALVGTALHCDFGPVSTLAMIIVAKQARGRGLGRELTQRLLSVCGDRATRLVATREGRPLYDSMGFAPVCAIAQHQGVAVAVAPCEGVDWAAPGDLAAILRLDAAASGMDRSLLLRRFAASERCAVLRRGGAVVAYAVLRAFGRGELVGPLVARDDAEAKALLAFLMNACAGAFLRVDAPETTGLSPWLAQYGLAHVGGGVAMQRGAQPPASDFKIFALASQAFG